ncbi:MAG: quinone oxidoreductase [Pseudomonadota bacterium]
MKAIRMEQTGGPDVMTLVDVDTPTPGDDEILIAQAAAGLNYIDVYHRSGLYPVPLPSGVGLEGAGVVEAVGAAVTGLAVGDRVAYCTGPIGAYAEKHVIKAATAAKLPDEIDFETAAGMMLKGCTAEYLVRRTYPVQRGDWVLFHAAAGGVGLIAGQWLRALGAHSIGTAGSDEKCALAKAHGFDHVINYSTENFAERVQDITDGKGVHVVYDGVGAATFDGSINSLRPRGMMVSYGNASGPVSALDTGILAQKGSLYLTRPTLFTYYASETDAQAGFSSLFDVVTRGDVSIKIEQRYGLGDASQAHTDLEARKTVGSTILLP